MKVVISGGIKTQNIVDGLNKKLNSGGVDFIVVPFIESIEEIYQRGEYFDKAILLEQCWNHDFEDEDETSLRNKVNQFATASSLRALDNVSFVFLTQDSETASQVFEEILPIHVNSVVLVKEPRYSVQFFKSLVTTEVDRFPAEIVYKPVFEEEIKAEDMVETTNAGPQYDTIYDEIDKTLFGGDEDEFNANRLNKKEEMEFKGFEPVVDDGNEPFEDTGLWTDETFGKDLSPEVEYEPAVEIQEEPLGSLPDDFDIGTQPGLTMETPETWDDTDFEPSNDIETQKQSEFPEFDTPDETFNVGEIPDYSGPSGVGINFEKDDMGKGFNNEPYMEEPYIEEPYIEEPYIEEPYIEEPFKDDIYQQEEYNPEFDSLHNGAQFPNGFNDTDYDGEHDVVAPIQPQYQRAEMSNDQIKATLDAFANRGNSILLTGCGGCGTSTMALNLANIINNLGYTVLLVDLDTENKAQSYMSKENYECVEPDSAGLMAAINSTSGINAHVSIVRQGFHLLTMGMASDSAQIDKVIQKEKISRFINLAKTSHNFVIYDVPFKTAIGFGKDFTFMADNVVVTLDCSNWGISKTMLNMCNIADDDMQETLFNRGQLLFNRYRILNKVMGNKVKTAIDITKVMDAKVRDLLGEDPGYYFQSMHISGLINEDKAFEAGWFESTQYSDTTDGSKLFIEVLKNIVLKR